MNEVHPQLVVVVREWRRSLPHQIPVPFHNADPWMRWAGVYEPWHWRIWQ